MEEGTEGEDCAGRRVRGTDLLSSYKPPLLGRSHLSRSQAGRVPPKRWGVGCECGLSDPWGSSV